MGTITDKLTRLRQTKTDIASAIAEKGQTVTDAEAFSAYPDKIRAIKTGIAPDELRRAVILEAETPYRGYLYLYIKEAENGNDCTIYWGDGKKTTVPANGGRVSHAYGGLRGRTVYIMIVGNRFSGFYTPQKNISQSLIKGIISMGSWPDSPITSMDRSFCEWKGLRYISRDAFYNLTEVESFLNCFGNCTKLETLPEGLFDRAVNAKDFTGCFFGATGLKQLPSGLFSKNTKAKTFKYCFSGCTSLQIRDDIFPGSFDLAEGETVDFFECFYRSSFSGEQGTAPALWENVPTAIVDIPGVIFAHINGLRCFGGDGNNSQSLSNYDSILPDWKWNKDDLDVSFPAWEEDPSVEEYPWVTSVSVDLSGYKLVDPAQVSVYGKRLSDGTGYDVDQENFQMPVSIQGNTITLRAKTNPIGGGIDVICAWVTVYT